MNYSQSANQNATNGEQDAKKIITHKELTSTQREDLVEQFVELVVDNMDTKTLVQYVTDDLIHFYENKCDDNELREFIDNYDEDLYEELLDNITSQTNNQGGQS